MSCQAVVVMAVPVEHGHCTFRHAGEQAALLVGDGLFRAHIADMDRPDIGDHADMRLDLAGQRLDLAGMIHADLEDAVARIASLVLVLPTEPVTLAIRALLRRRPARPRLASAFMVSGTRISVPPATSTSHETTAAAAPRFIASPTKP